MPNLSEFFHLDDPDASATRRDGSDRKNSRHSGCDNTQNASMLVDAEALRQQAMHEGYLAGLRDGQQQAQAQQQRDFLFANHYQSSPSVPLQNGGQQHGAGAAPPPDDQKMPARQYADSGQNDATAAWNQAPYTVPTMHPSATHATGRSHSGSASLNRPQQNPQAERMDNQNGRASLPPSDYWESYMERRAIESPPDSGPLESIPCEPIDTIHQPQFVDYEQWYNHAASSKAPTEYLVDICRTCIAHDPQCVRTTPEFRRRCTAIVQQDDLRNQYHKLMKELQSWRSRNIDKKLQVIHVLCAFIELGNHSPNEDFRKRARKIHRCAKKCGAEKILYSDTSPSQYSCQDCKDDEGDYWGVFSALHNLCSS